jgi:type III secretion protein R
MLLQRAILLFILLFSANASGTSLEAAPISVSSQPNPTETGPRTATGTAAKGTGKDQAKGKSTLTPVPPGQITNFTALDRPSLITQGAAIVLMSLMPFLVMILSSFVKIVVVLSLLRNALGVQQAPPNQVLNGVAFLLSIYVMFPTGVKMYDAAQPVIARQNIPQELISGTSAQYVIEVATAAREPLREFLKNNSLVKHQRIFFRTVYRLLPEDYRDTLKPDDFMIVVPSFITTQLKSAFEIGVLIYIPFFVIDLVVSNILLAMGMMMLSPVTISMPLKLFLLVMLDGWTLLIEGLVATFR